MESRPSSRRRFLDRLVGFWTAGVLGSVLYPILRYLVPPEIPEAPTQSVSAGSASMPPNSGRVVPFGSKPAIVIRTPAGEYRAFTAVCTHLSCTVQYRDDLEHIWCACHNGHYDLQGANIAGPPPRPLEPYEIHVSDEELVISKRG
jgi:Rieske Fe-S protein